MKQFLFIIALISSATAFAQDFYDLYTIQKIEVFFPFSNWDKKMDSTGITENFMLASQVKINGVTFDSVGVKYKGNSSFNINNKKNPWHIELDNVKAGQNYQGIADIKLGNNFADPSFMREVLGYTILQNYMHAPRGNYVNLYVNGVYRGLYTNQEAVTKTFCMKHFNSKNGPFFKCNRPVTGAPGSPNLVPSANTTMSDSLTYYARVYEMKSDRGWKQFIQAQFDLQKNIDTLWDVDRALWMLAFNNVFVNLDSYTGSSTQNYYEYMDDYNKFNSVVWDVNMCMGGFVSLATGAPLNFTQMQQLSPLANSTLATRPLLSKLLANAQYKKQYIAHLKTMVKEILGTNAYYTLGANLQNLIKNDVLADSLKFYTYTAFLANLDTVASIGGTGTKIGIKQLLEERRKYLVSTPEFIQSAPIISNIKMNKSNPLLYDTIWISAQFNNASTGYAGIRDNNAKHFEKLKMYDDGTHHDSMAGDGIYGTSFIVSSGKMEYYIYAENANAGIFSPERAEHEFYKLIASIPILTPGNLVINELMSSNISFNRDPAGEFDDWVELKNNSNQTINLSGLYLSDDSLNIAKWAFPDGTQVGKNNYLLIWLDEDGSQNGLHANFKLSSGGERITLGYANGSLIDSVVFGVIKDDSSFGRCNDGNGNFAMLSKPTPIASNSCTFTQRITNLNFNYHFSCFPNPANNYITINGTALIQNIRLYNVLGSSLREIKSEGTYSQTLDMHDLTKGVYFLEVNHNHRYRIILK